jgi:hypothetical protein
MRNCGEGMQREPRGEKRVGKKKKPRYRPFFRDFFFSFVPFFLPGRVFGRDVLPCTTFQRHLQHLFSLCTYRVFIWPTHPNFQRAKPKLCVLRVSLSGCVSPPNSPSLHNCAVLLVLVVLLELSTTLFCPLELESATCASKPVNRIKIDIIRCF